MVKLRYRDFKTLSLVFALSVSGQALSAQTAYTTEASKLELTFGRLLSSISIKARQIATTGRQVGVVALKSSEAQASAIATVGERLRTVNGATDYVMGRDQVAAACAVPATRAMAQAARAKSDKLKAEANAIEQRWVAGNGSAADTITNLTVQRQNYYCPDEEYAAGLCGQVAGLNHNTGVGAGDTSPVAFIDGNAHGAEEIAVGMDFIDRLAPMPSIPEKKDMESAASRIIAIRRAAGVSMARTLLAGSVFEGVE